MGRISLRFHPALVMGKRAVPVSSGDGGPRPPPTARPCSLGVPRTSCLVWDGAGPKALLEPPKGGQEKKFTSCHLFPGPEHLTGQGQGDPKEDKPEASSDSPILHLLQRVNSLG